MATVNNTANAPVFEFMESKPIDNVMAVMKSCHEKVNVTFDQDNIDCVHRIRKKYTDENTGKKIQ